MSSVVEIDSAQVEKRVCADLRRRFQTEQETRSTRSTTYYDTFEWRLHRNGTFLSEWRNGDDTVVCWQDKDGRVLHRMLGVPLPGFVHQMPEGAFRDALAPQADVRRLLPAVRVELLTTELRLLDDNRKTIARARFERGFATGPDKGDPRKRLPGTLTIVPLFGYERKSKRVARFIERELGLRPAEPSPLLRALAAVKRSAAVSDTRLKIKLDPAMKSVDATRAILLHLFEAMRLNEDGLRRDLDSEFLHDFRVAGRRTRAALGQLEQVFPPESLDRFRTDFKWLGTLTGPTRDLDVYLLKLPGYRTLLPRELRDDLDPLEALLVQRQRKEHARLVSGLNTQRYRNLLLDWPKFLSGKTSTSEPAAEADRPVHEVASERILRLYRRVMKRGRRAIESPSADRMHRLRLECKKFRYLLEFFAGLYDPAEVRRAVRTLKKLQDNLGDFNDLDVQQRALSGFAHELATTKTSSERTLIALGRLVERLAAEQERIQREFRERFERFATRENQLRVRKLLSGGEKRS